MCIRDSRQTDRQADRQAGRQADRHTETDRHTEIDSYTETETERQTETETEVERFEPTATRFVSFYEPTSFPSIQTGLNLLIQGKQFQGLRAKRISARPTPSLKFNRPKTWCPSI